MFYKFYNKPGASGAGIKVGACKAPCYSVTFLQLVELFDLEIHPHDCQKHEIEADIFCTKCCYRQLEHMWESP